MKKDTRQPSTIAIENWMRWKAKKNKSAVALGKLGGRVKSDKKTKASQQNGKLGGRPKKVLSNFKSLLDKN